MASESPQGVTNEARSSVYKKKAYAFMFIIMIIITWIAIAELMQGVEDNYPKPFFLRFIVHAFYSLCLPIWVILGMLPWTNRHKSLPNSSPPVENSSTAVFTPTAHLQPSTRHKSPSSRLKRIRFMKRYPLGYFDWTYLFSASIVLGSIAFLSGWLWFLSLPMTSISGNMAIYQSTSVMVYFFSIWLLNENVTFLKSLAVVVSIMGAMLISFFPAKETTLKAQIKSIGTISDTAISAISESVNVQAPLLKQYNHPSLFGYLICFLSMALFSFYEVLYKMWASHPNDPVPLQNSLRFLGLLGASTVLFWGPILLFLDVVGFETFELPQGEKVRVVLILAGVDTVSNLFLLFAIMLSSPLFTSVGCLLGLPVGIAWDRFVHSYELPFFGLVGVGCIIMGFGCFIVDDMKNPFQWIYKFSYKKKRNQSRGYNVLGASTS